MCLITFKRLCKTQQVPPNGDEQFITKEQGELHYQCFKKFLEQLTSTTEEDIKLLKGIKSLT